MRLGSEEQERWRCCRLLELACRSGGEGWFSTRQRTEERAPDVLDGSVAALDRVAHGGEDKPLVRAVGQLDVLGVLARSVLSSKPSGSSVAMMKRIS